MAPNLSFSSLTHIYYFIRLQIYKPFYGVVCCSNQTTSQLLHLHHLWPINGVAVRWLNIQFLSITSIQWKSVCCLPAHFDLQKWAEVENIAACCWLQDLWESHLYKTSWTRVPERHREMKETFAKQVRVFTMWQSASIEKLLWWSKQQRHI